jgi:hypothetical protein
MNDLNEDTDWQAVRRAMNNKIAATSLRDLARDLGGVSPSGLQNFLDGATPKRRGGVYLEWFLKEGPRWGADDDVLEAAIDVVVRGTPRERRGEVRAYVEQATGIANRG